MKELIKDLMATGMTVVVFDEEGPHKVNLKDMTIEVADTIQEKFDAIPFYELGDTPDNLCEETPALYRQIIAKRALVKAYEDVEMPDGIVDLLTDLRHLCDAVGLCYGDLDRIAYGHYTEEKGGFWL